MFNGKHCSKSYQHIVAYRKVMDGVTINFQALLAILVGDSLWRAHTVTAGVCPSLILNGRGSKSGYAPRGRARASQIGKHRTDEVSGIVRRAGI